MKIVRVRDGKTLFETENENNMKKWVDENIDIRGCIPYYKNSIVVLVKNTK